MDFGTMAQWAGAALSLVAILIAVLNRHSDKVEAQDKRLQQVEADMAKMPSADKVQDIDRRQDRIDQRIKQVEADMKHLPSKDMVHEMQLSLVELRGQIALVVEGVKPIKAISERMQDWALEGARK